MVNDDNGVTEVKQVFESLLYGVLMMIWWLVCKDIARAMSFKVLDFEAQEWRFYGQFWCCTPKFSLSFLKTFLTKNSLMTQACTSVD